MNEEKSASNEASEAGLDTSTISAGDGTLQTNKEFESDKTSETDHYYDVDTVKKDVETSIGDGEMRNEGTVGSGDIPEENAFTLNGPTDRQEND